MTPSAAAQSQARALRVRSLAIRDLRNLASVELEPGPRFNVLWGDNGAGKTSVIEAIDYLATLESFRGARTDDLVREGREHALVAAELTTDSAMPVRRFRVALHRHAPRQVSVDGKRPRSSATYHASVHTVLFHPGDLEIASGGPEPRRALLDRVLGQMDATYAAATAAYSKALRSRNRLLRTEGVDRRSIVAYDEILASAGTVVGQARERLASELGPRAEEAFHEVAGAELPLQVRYRPRVEPSVPSLRRALEKSLEKDLARGFTAEGPHADDVYLGVRGTAARRHASQGQHRAIVLSLKVAEMSVLARRTGVVPILLLDDVSSELDREHNRRFFGVLSGLGGQVFLTTTQRELIRIDRDRVDFHVVRGEIER